MRLKHLVPPLVAVAPVALAVACYGPTEVTLEVTTDLPCEVTTAPGQPLRTAFYKGPPLGPEEEASTESCTLRPGADAFVGSLVLVPSGDSNGRASVKVVLTHGPFQPSDCEAHPEECIVATRSFSFIEHLSRRVPIRMLKECLGVPCPDGTTCDVGGKCVAAEVRDDGTLAPDPTPSSPPDAGAPIDAAPIRDATPELTTQPICRGPLGNGVLHTVNGNVSAAAAGTDQLYFVSAEKLYRVPKAGGPPIELMSGAGGVVAAHDSLWAAAFIGDGAWKIRYPAQQDVDAHGEVLSLALGQRSGNIVGYALVVDVLDSRRILKWPPDGAKTVIAKGFERIALDGTNVYLARAEGVTIAGSAGSPVIALNPADGATTPVFATFGGAVFAGGMGTQVGEILALGPATPRIRLTTRLSDFAVDQDFYYWTDGDQIKRMGRNATPSQGTFSLGTDDHVTHLAVDDTCLYYWGVARNAYAAQATLRVLPKTPKPGL